ncbi:hypothetical protein EMPG_14536 [Blastomyces silverae]|uniref:RlpA-like protein double-psi beta-barrel domain-containing protein n=1 Tax=Blastomyces silverae TaxID=2060906 RepID=A0A0H1BLJ1_9EURO|nr:hypothetical protein EMPG_14536 [Blastomyces silverae]
MTFYDGGVGSCGVNVKTFAEDAIAMPVGLMGNLSNDNPFCGQKVNVKFRGKTFTATVRDKCIGCKGGDIDMTRSLFYKFAHEDEGRLAGVEWWFD